MLMDYKYCYECEKETRHYNGKCAICEANREIKERKGHFAKLDKMTVEERIRRIERILYGQGYPPTDIDI